MSNVYHESERFIDDLKSGRVPHRSIVSVQYPSGNTQSIRFHYWNEECNKLVGCDMSWDNLALEEYDISRGVVVRVTMPPNKQTN